MAKLRLFGCIHTNRQSVVESDLEGFADGVDAFAIENPVFDSVREMCLAILAVPVVTIGLNLFGVIQMTMFLVGHRDIIQTELLAVRAVADERPIHGVDRSPIALLADRGWPWIAGNWVVLVVLFGLDPVSTLYLVGVTVLVSGAQTVRRRGYRYPGLALAVLTVVATGAFVVTGRLNVLQALFPLVVALPVVALTIGSRNEVMLDEVAELAEENDYDDVCLLTGWKHLDGMLDIAPSHGLTVTAAFKPLWRGPGRRLDTDWEPVPYGALTEAGGRLDERALARLVDWVVVGALLTGALLVAGLAASAGYFQWETAVVSGAPLTYTHLVFLSIAAIPVGYYTGLEGLFDRTVGKRVTGLTVRQYDGTSVGVRTGFLRAVVSWLDFLPVGHVFGAVVSAKDDYGRRVADKLAATVVIPADASVGEPTRPASEPLGNGPLTGPDRTDESGDHDDGVTGSGPAGEIDEERPAETSIDPAEAETADSAGAAEPSGADTRPDEPERPETTARDSSAGEIADAEWTE